MQVGEATVLIDPFESQSGLSVPRFKFDLLIKTLAPYPLKKTDLLDTEVTEIFGPGQYNAKNIDIQGFGLIKESSEKFLKTVYLLKAEGLKLCLLGHISEMPSPEISEFLEEVDVLFIPAGGKPFLNQALAAKLIKQIEPKIVIPSFYKVSGLKRPSDDLKEFLEEANHQKIEPQEKFSVKKKDLADIKSAQVVVLKI